jgi:hypothetical protein
MTGALVDHILRWSAVKPNTRPRGAEIRRY